MKQLISILVLVLLPVVFFNEPAYCGDNANIDWNGLEWRGTLEVEIPVSYRWDINTALHRLEISSRKISQNYAYLGFDYLLIGDTLLGFKIGPRFGVVEGFYDETAPLTSVFATYNYYNIVNLFLEGDIYFKDGPRDYYGYYTIDYSFSIAYFGVSIEHINRHYWVGPKLGICAKDATIELQQWYFPDDYATGIRMSFILRL